MTSVVGKPVGTTPGAIFVGGLFQNFSLGIILAQYTRYTSSYKDDSKRKQVFVRIVVATSLLQTVLESYKAWTVTVQRQDWSRNPLQWNDMLINGILCALCEGFYVRRCHSLLNKSKWIFYYPVSFISLTIIASNVYLTIAVQLSINSLDATNDTLASTKELIPSVCPFCFLFTTFIYIANKDNCRVLVLDFGLFVLGRVSDSNIHSVMWQLWKSKTGLIETDKLVVHIITLTWESTILPVLSMFCAAILYHTSTVNKEHLALFFVLVTGKLYVLGLLRTLNSRVGFRERIQSNGDIGRTSLSDWKWEQDSNARSSTVITEPPRTFDASATLRHSADFPPNRSQPDSIVHSDDISNSFASVASRIGSTPEDLTFSTPLLDSREEGNRSRHRAHSPGS